MTTVPSTPLLGLGEAFVLGQALLVAAFAESECLCSRRVLAPAT